MCGFTMIALATSRKDYEGDQMRYFCVAVFSSILLYSLGILLQWIFYKKGNFWHKNGVDVGFRYDHINEPNFPESGKFLSENGLELGELTSHDVPDWLKLLKGHWVIE